jgi:dTDP-4-amino-4,6-dideoxygalactose transaminase
MQAVSRASKENIHELAIFGGSPAFAQQLHVGRPNIGSREKLMALIEDALDRRWFSNGGPYVKELEARLSEITGAKHCIAICNGTVALEIAIRALGMTGEVLVPAFTFVATAHALQWQEITPVFCDIAPGTHNIDPAKIERHITPRTSGIIGVHVWGEPCAIDELQAIANKHDLGLLFDSAHAFGCTYKGQMIGNFGDAEVFSFHATKFLNSFEGGAIATNDDDLAQKIRFMQNFGFSNYDQVDYIGINGKMNEISAAMGLTSLDSMDEFITVNFRNYCAYQAGFEGLSGVRLFRYNEKEHLNYQYIIVEIDDRIVHVSRDDIVRILHKENVLARRYFYPGVHQMEPYRSYYPHAGLLLPNTEALTKRVLQLPTGTHMSEDDVHHVIELLHYIVTNGEAISARLKTGVK